MQIETLIADLQAIAEGNPGIEVKVNSKDGQDLLDLEITDVGTVLGSNEKPRFAFVEVDFE